MERTVPHTASDEVELYLRTYYSLLRSTSDVQILTLEEAHSGMNSLLHPHARDEIPDMSAFLYSLLRSHCHCHCWDTSMIVCVTSHAVPCGVKASHTDCRSWRPRRNICRFPFAALCITSTRSGHRTPDLA